MLGGEIALFLTPQLEDITIFSVLLLLTVFVLTILEVFIIITKDVSSEVENCTRDHLLFNGKAHVKVNSQGGLILVIFKLPFFPLRVFTLTVVAVTSLPVFQSIVHPVQLTIS